MLNSKLEFAGAALLVLVAGGSAFADDPPPSQQPTGAAPAGDTTTATTTEEVTCPAPQASCPPQTQTAAMPTEPEPAPPPAEYTPAYNWVHDVGLGLSVGGGVDDFASSALRNTTNTGGSWNARLTLGTHSYVAGELSYIGSAQTIQRLGLASNTELVGNGAQAVLRLNGTIHYMFQPFIFGGAAWRHYSLNTSSTNLSDVSSSNDAFEVPLGLGAAAYFEGLMIDVRGEYRFGWTNNPIIPESATSASNPAADRWGVTGNIGYSF